MLHSFPICVCPEKASEIKLKTLTYYINLCICQWLHTLTLRHHYIMDLSVFIKSSVLDSPSQVISMKIHGCVNNHQTVNYCCSTTPLPSFYVSRMGAAEARLTALSFTQSLNLHLNYVDNRYIQVSNITFVNV